MDPIIIFFICYFALSAVLTVALVGKEREPITPGVGSIMILIYLLFIYLLAQVG